MKQGLIGGISLITLTVSGAMVGQANPEISKETIKEYMQEDYEKRLLPEVPPLFEVKLPSFSHHYTYSDSERLKLYPNIRENTKELYKFTLDRTPDCGGAPPCKEHTIRVEKVSTSSPSLWDEISEIQTLDNDSEELEELSEKLGIELEKMQLQRVDLGENIEAAVLPTVCFGRCSSGVIMFEDKEEGKRYTITKDVGNKQEMVEIAESAIENPIILTPNPNRDNQSNSRLNDLLQDESRVVEKKWCFPGGAMEPAEMHFWSNGLLEIRSVIFDESKESRFFTWNFITPNSLRIEFFGEEEWEAAKRHAEHNPDLVQEINEDSNYVDYKVFPENTIYFLHWAFTPEFCR